MKLAIGSGPDVVPTIARCHELGVTNVFLNGPGVPGVQETGVPDPASVGRAVDALRREGITVDTASWWFGRFPARPWRSGSSDPGFLLEPRSPIVQAEAEALRVLGDAGITRLLHYVDIARPERPDQEPACWDGLVRAYERLIHVAATAGVGIGTHSLHRLLPESVRGRAFEEGVTVAGYGTWRARDWGGPFLVDTWEALVRLVDAVDTPVNGVTLCTGMDFLGADLPALIHRFADRIHACQIRDHTDTWPAGAECPLGRGRVGIADAIGALREVGYTGIVHPEHLGRPAPDEDPLADAVRTLRSMGVGS